MELAPDYMRKVVTGDDSGDDSGDEGPGRSREDEEDTEEIVSPVSEPVEFAQPPANCHLHEIDERAPSPETVLLKGSQENMGPSAEADSEFEKELAKMRTDTSAESRRMDRKTALTLWESAALPTGLKKKRVDGFDEDGDASAEEPVMNFMLITKRGKQQQVSLCVLRLSMRLPIEKLFRPVKSLSLRSPPWLCRHVRHRCKTVRNNSS